MRRYSLQQMKQTLRFFLDPSVAETGVTFTAPRLGDAGFDVRSSVSLVLNPGDQVMVQTGLRVAIPSGWVGFIKDRSSMALRRLYTHGGVIDASYRGEIKILLSNRSAEPFEIAVGDKIAQMVVLPCLTEMEEAGTEEELGETDRAENGFGSTGR